VADDHEILRSGLVALLEDHPELEVVGAAADGLMALELARATRPDVIVMDITMPRLNGIEATRRITRELPQVRVIGLSMHEREDMATAMREAGAVAYLAKSGPTDELIAAILRR
jgi:DNA-binding NarL/FixJ family response regulator